MPIRRLLLPLALIAAFVLAPHALVRASVAGTGPAGGLVALLHLESSPPVFNVLYRFGDVAPAANGAYGANIRAKPSAWFLEEQRAGAVDVLGGVLRLDGDPALIATGLKMFRYGLARENRQGRFPGSAWPFHGTAMFLSEAAPSLLILQSSQYSAQFAAELKYDISHMQRAARAMVATVGGPGGIDDHTKNHRWFEAAIALKATGLLAHDRTLQAWSLVYLRQGIAMQRANGVMPEDGGHDSGYQALGMSNATRMLALLPEDRLHRALYRALARGEAWELSRIAANGTVNQGGDTRTRGCVEHSPNGACKTVFYAPIFDALARWAAISGDPRYARAAHAVWVRSGYGG